MWFYSFYTVSECHQCLVFGFSPSVNHFILTLFIFVWFQIFFVDLIHMVFIDSVIIVLHLIPPPVWNCESFYINFVYLCVVSDFYIFFKCNWYGVIIIKIVIKHLRSNIQWIIFDRKIHTLWVTLEMSLEMAFL